MRDKFPYLLSCSPLEFFTVIIETFYLYTAAIQIHFSKPGTVIQKLQHISSQPPKSHFFLKPLTNLSKSRLVSLLEALDRNLFSSPSCLRRSLALSRLGRALGFAPELKIGIYRIASALQAHSWLEYEGIRLEVENDGSIYAELLPSEAVS